LLWWLAFEADRLAAQRRNAVVCPLFSVDPAGNIWKNANRPCTVRNQLKRPKTAKGIFGKAWRFQAENLEKLGAGLEKLGAGFNI
jgi:hypothetical protein